ncbi:cytochrome c [Defluviimonas sp. WL0002]|uniref:Cytochrome c n=1 Tax=Albidovulum marisflavi TaxID=2984159 RepID=A0ABT2ZDN2_9RHOB|nr:cytochrome c [Defluviimonas sp. WL0002]MCV2869232.1 cytochrome c [Defluviimonas sp. WL0002]
MLLRLVILVASLAAGSVRAEEERSFALFVTPEVIETGLIEYILPRFTLKTGRRAVIVNSDGDAEIRVAGPNEQPQLARGDTGYSLTLVTDNPAAALFAGWLSSAPGRAAITGFEPGEGPAFHVPERKEALAEAAFEGDAALGREIARRHCARCHRVEEGKAMGIGTTPSFAALRALPDWDERFQTFFVRRPHPTFVQIEDLSAPFDPASPPAIVPLKITLDEFEALLAYASDVKPADLGAQIQNR